MLLVLRHCWGPCTTHSKHPQVLLRTWKSLGLSLQPWFSFFWCCHCHISAHPTEHHPVTSLTHPVAFFHMKEWGEHLEMTFFCGWCGPQQTSNPHVSALPDPLVQLLSHSSKKPTWKAVNLVFLENMVLREDVGDLKCLRVCKDKEQIKKKQKQTI